MGISVLAKRACTSNGPFEELPIELLLSICANLDPWKQVSLALTTKALYSSIFPTTPLTKHQSHQVIHRLERDNPDLLICRRCRRLYKWRHRPQDAGHDCSCTDRWEVSNRASIDLTASWRRYVSETSLYEGFPSVYFTPALRSLILRRNDTDDPRFGLPFEALQHCYRAESPQLFSGIQTQHLKMAPCIHDDRLLLRIERFFDINDLKKFRAVTAANLPSSPLRAHEKPRLRDIVLRQINARLDFIDFFNNSMIHCQHCVTDTLITVIPRNLAQDDSLSLWITSWHDLGRQCDRGEPINGFSHKQLLGREKTKLALSRRLAKLFHTSYPKTFGRDADGNTRAPVDFAPEVDRRVSAPGGISLWMEDHFLASRLGIVEIEVTAENRQGRDVARPTARILTQP